jgi:mxaK protein
MNIQDLFSVKKITYFSILILSISSYLIISALISLYQITKFNENVIKGEAPKFFSQSFESRFSTAYWLAEKGTFKESTVLFNNLLTEANEEQKSAVQHNIGNIFFLRGLAIIGTSMDARPEAEYLLRQAKKSYIQSIKASNVHWDTKHNLDRILTMLPADPTPGVGDSDSPGLIMGNIPVGLP